MAHYTACPTHSSHPAAIHKDYKGSLSHAHTHTAISGRRVPRNVMLEFLKNLQDLELMDWARPADDECGGVVHKCSKAFLYRTHRTEALHRLHIHIHTHGCFMCGNGIIISHK